MAAILCRGRPMRKSVLPLLLAAALWAAPPVFGHTPAPHPTGPGIDLVVPVVPADVKATAVPGPAPVPAAPKPAPGGERLQIPSELPGATAPPIRLPDRSDPAAREKALRELYPPLPALGEDPAPQGQPLTLSD